MRRPSQRILEREFEQRLSINPAYSKRAFARQLTLAPSFLNYLMTGQRRLTSKVAHQLAQSLSLPESELNILLRESVGFENDLDTLADSENALPIEIFRPIGDWWCVAVLEFLETNAKDHSAATIGKRLGIPKTNVSLALKRLSDLGFIEKHPRNRDRYRKTSSAQYFFSGAPSDTLRRFHTQLLEKAKEAIYLQAPDKRVVGSMTIAVDPADIPEINRRWNEFRSELEKFIEQGKRRSDVYTAIFEMFPLTNQSLGKDLSK